MKILYYSSHPNLNLASPSGYGTHMREMIAAFKELGHEVKPVIMGGTTLGTSSLQIKKRGSLKQAIASLIPAYVWESAKDYRVLYFDKQAFKSLDAEIKEFQPDLIYERATYLQTSGVRAAKKWGIKHVLEVNAPYAEERKELQGNSHFLQSGLRVENEQLKMTNKVVVVSSALKTYLMAAYHISADRFVITPNAINPEHLKFDNASSEKLREDLQLRQEKVIGFVGSIFPWHGVDLLIEAFRKLIEAGNEDVHLLIVGDGEVLSSLKKQAALTGLANKITFTGNVPHTAVFNYLQAMDVCVMGKSNWYGSPVKIFEYGAMGKAIVAPDTTPVRDVCTHKENALLVQPTAESIFEALVLLISNQQLREAIAQKFKAQVLSQHTWLDNAKKVIASIA